MYDDRPDVQARLDDDLVVWMTTVSPQGRPQPSLVWFLVSGDVIVIYSRDGTPRMRNLRANPHVSLHLNSDETGSSGIVIWGSAEMMGRSPYFYDDADYHDKYRSEMKRLGYTNSSFATDYPERLHIHPTRLRAP